MTQVRIVEWPGYKEAGMTDKSAAELFNKIEGSAPQPRKNTLLATALIVGTILIYGGGFLFLAVNSIKVLTGSGH